MCLAQSTWHNGQLHVGGGYIDQSSGRRDRERASLYSYTPGESKWTVIETPTNYYGLATYQSKLLLIGGRKYPSRTRELTNKIWKLDKKSHQGWTIADIPPLLTSREFPSIVVVRDLLTVAAGRGHNARYLDLVEIYSSETQSWLPVTSLPQPGHLMSFAIIGHHLFVGNKVGKEVYRCCIDKLLSSLQWQTITKVPHMDSTIASFQGLLLSMGGKPDSFSYSSEIFFHQAQSSWCHIGNLPMELENTIITVTPSGELMVIAGYNRKDSIRYSTRVFKMIIHGKLYYNN